MPRTHTLSLVGALTRLLAVVAVAGSGLLVGTIAGLLAIAAVHPGTMGAGATIVLALFALAGLTVALAVLAVMLGGSDRRSGGGRGGW